jgi:ribonuclease P protein component
MLAAAHRLRRREEFSAVMRAGRRAARGTLVVHLFTADADDGVGRAASPPGAAPGVRVGFVIPRTVGNAVARNTVRRRLRHLMRDRLSVLPDDARVVIRALPGSAASPYPRLESDLDAALTAARTRRRRPSAEVRRP